MNTVAGRTTGGGTRNRTRRAILDAAAAVLAKNPAASLADVAAAADVGRTTVHRYFAERSDLLRALGADALEKATAATGRARTEEGAPLAALERLCQELFELGDVLSLVFDETLVAAWSWEGWEQDTEADRALIRLVERGHAEGAFDPGLDPDWISQVLWSLLYVAWQRSRAGDTKHEALSLCLRTLRKAVAP
ncbi:TetR/AcrR family transcriptional regulator [Streptomyces sp. DSM 44917]|uniref:TetR/AcrR family transcriptional regulator n=1 Tax=Streptomyces boetiae TaxID=3075541 RepID=A0ABU2LF70_9ACTN|nr:TetR/AcrR family transcriptional regulator [Streptomyces sp. DSM 44917]MDT0310136.1 TetR/AcrR family transcriptional regulator [Streptomyces sp. DSM 44917]